MLWISRVYSSTTSTLPANTNVRARFQLITRSGSNEALSSRTGSMCADIPPRSCLWWVDGPIAVDGEYANLFMYHTPRRQEKLLPPASGGLYRSLLPGLMHRQSFLT